MNNVKLENFEEYYIMENKTIWFSQIQMASIFNKSISTINEHIKVIEASKPDSVKKFKVVQLEGKRNIKRDKLHYDLDFVYTLGIKAREYELSTALLDKCSILGVNLNEVRFLPIKEQEFCKLVKESLNGITHFEEQYRVGKYRIDLFCTELSLAVEYDERHHRKDRNLNLDLKREQVIKGLIKGVSFIRVVEGEEYQGLNKIIKFILSSVYRNSYKN